jgi:DHA3 family macrolide efflux protein-like MFS transporter
MKRGSSLQAGDPVAQPVQQAGPGGQKAGETFSLGGSFKALFAGQVSSIFGDRINNIALIEIIAMRTSRFADTGSIFELSNLTLAMTVPSLLFAPFAGALVDRVSRKKVLVTANTLRGLAVMSILFLRPNVPLGTYYGIVAFLYVMNLLYVPARCAVMPEIVPREKLLRANSILTAGATVAAIAGFVIGGIVSTKLGWRTAIFINALAYLGSAGAMALVKLRERGPVAVGQEHHLPYFRSIAAGAAEIVRSAKVRLSVLAPPLVIIAGTVAYVIGVPNIEGLSADATMHIGFISGLAGAGMAAGSYMAMRVLSGVSRSVISGTCTALVCVVLSAFGFTTSFAVLGATAVLAGLAAGPVYVSSETTIQEESTEKRRATVFAFRDMLMKGVAAGTAPLAGLLDVELGTRNAILLLLAITLAVSILATRRDV